MMVHIALKMQWPITRGCYAHNELACHITFYSKSPASIADTQEAKG